MHAHDDPRTSAEQAAAKAWFERLRDTICSAFEALEDQGGVGGSGPPGRFQRKPWTRKDHTGATAAAAPCR